MATSRDELCRRRAPAGTGPQLGNLGAVARDNENLAACDSVEDLSPVVAQLSNGDRLHEPIVSPVRRDPADSSARSSGPNIEVTGKNNGLDAGPVAVGEALA